MSYHCRQHHPFSTVSFFPPAAADDTVIPLCSCFFFIHSRFTSSRLPHGKACEPLGSVCIFKYRAGPGKVLKGVNATRSHLWLFFLYRSPPIILSFLVFFHFLLSNQVVLPLSFPREEKIIHHVLYKLYFQTSLLPVYMYFPIQRYCFSSSLFLLSGWRRCMNENKQKKKNCIQLERERAAWTFVCVCEGSLLTVKACGIFAAMV